MIFLKEEWVVDPRRGGLPRGPGCPSEKRGPLSEWFRIHLTILRKTKIKNRGTST